MKLYWTLERIQASAKKYKTHKEWRKNEPKAFGSAVKKKLLSKTKNLERTNERWTRAKIKEVVKNYKSFKEWIKKDKKGSYTAALRRGLLNDIDLIGHLDKGKFGPHNRKKIIWNRDSILKDALLYNSRSSWKRNSGSAVVAAIKIGCFNDATKHMAIMGSRFKRCLYSIEIKGTKEIYIGLTLNYENRIKEHLKKQFKNYSKKQLLIKKLTRYISKDRTADLEDKLIESKKKSGYKVLNQRKGGGLGGKILVWTKEKILEDAKKYQHKSEWVKGNQAAYQAALKYDQSVSKFELFNKATAHMTTPKARKKWTKEIVLADAKKYNYRSEWRKANEPCYRAASRLNILSKATSHMPERKLKYK